MLSLSGCHVRVVAPIRRSAAQPVDPACFSRRQTGANTALPRHDPERPLRGPPAYVFNAQPIVWAVSGSFFTPRIFPEFRAQTPRTRCLNRPSEWLFRNPFGSDRRGTQTHSRRTGRRLRQLLDARQGLVRVSESNTKYGGKRRKTGDGPGLFSSQLSVSPQGFPNEKIVLRGGESRLLPLFTGQLFLGVLGLRLGDSGKATESAGLISRPAAGFGRRLAAMPEFSPRFPPVGLSGSV
jgi:hypothetical protein